ncbi:Muscle M-line assembly protein unc-89 [Wickerhamomyces ciferrii]|uniref:Muscle M-line assembly protein unc-89 n=1 Tax=Wickerhamomyces ciferrii (strain ATCC 14091 / BCRC 22168 / CBS 111 / JCM 3599 / NBRC 0793 / NRRL Y-1031 F-60-10) TaxID=1206466 RepID=K0KHS8_WICCF|nr:Muscle M-line assembly protein unc-89 [Wickerhamomyces ciferrii]CCH44755.1 Muscle M-line assembly protein unc-89 [Wickerhamomyces ciferrii]
MGKPKNHKKNKIPIETVYIAPPKNVQTEEVEYDPKTRVTDPFENDLDFLLTTTAHTTVEGPLSSTSTNIKSNKSSSLPIDQIEQSQVPNESSKPKVTKKTKKEILSFDISFSSDDDEKDDIGNMESIDEVITTNPSFSKKSNINRGTKPKTSEEYLAKELGLDSSDTDDSSSDFDADYDSDAEDFDLVNELYEKLNIKDFSDSIIGEELDEDEEEQNGQIKNKPPKKRKPRSKKPRESKEPKKDENKSQTDDIEKKKSNRKSRSDRRRIKREAERQNNNEKSENLNKTESKQGSKDSTESKSKQQLSNKSKNNKKDTKNPQDKNIEPHFKSQEQKPDKPNKPRWAIAASKKGNLKQKNFKNDELKPKGKENKSNDNNDKPHVLTRSQLINQESGSKKEKIPNFGDSKKSSRSSRSKKPREKSEKKGSETANTNSSEVKSKD